MKRTVEFEILLVQDDQSESVRVPYEGSVTFPAAFFQKDGRLSYEFRVILTGKGHGYIDIPMHEPIDFSGTEVMSATLFTRSFDSARRRTDEDRDSFSRLFEADCVRLGLKVKKTASSANRTRKERAA